MEKYPFKLCVCQILIFIVNIYAAIEKQFTSVKQKVIYLCWDFNSDLLYPNKHK